MNMEQNEEAGPSFPVEALDHEVPTAGDEFEVYPMKNCRAITEKEPQMLEPQN